MDGSVSSIFPNDLYARLGTASAPIVVDVRRAVPGPSDRLMVSAFHRPPDEVARWSNLALGRPVVVYCRQGHDVSQGVAAALRAAGIDYGAMAATYVDVFMGAIRWKTVDRLFLECSSDAWAAGAPG
jgi:rhodanese-related sulfurtransferase